MGWDVSLGGSAGQGAKAAQAGAESSGMLKKLAKAAKAAADSNAPLTDVAKNKNVAKAAKELAGLAGNEGVSGLKGVADSGGQILKLSFGPAMQVGVWMGFGTTVHVNDFNSCGCNVYGCD